MRRMALPRLIHRAGRWCRTGAVCAVLAYAALGFLSLNLSPGPTGVRSATLTGWSRGIAAPARVTSTSGEHGGGYAVMRGVLSVHTGRSHDAEGTLDEVAEAARNSGLDFVVLGDHPGEWARQNRDPLAPHHRDGVLMVPGLELVIPGVGRMLAVGLDTVPRRWEAPVQALVQRAERAGAFLSVVHPRSPRARERWSGLRVPGVHAWESFDISEMARLRLQEPWAAYYVATFLGGLLVGRGEGSLEALWRGKTETPALLSYDSVRAVQRVSLTGGLNHHPKLRFAGLLLPRYEPFFRTVVNHVLVPGGLSGDPVRARTGLLHALRAGRLFVSLGDPDSAGGFRMQGRAASETSLEMGEAAAWSPGSTLELRMPDGSRGELLVRVLRNGAEEVWLRAGSGEHVSWPVEDPGVYRVEIFRGGVRLGAARAGFRPWILSNPVEFYHPRTDRLAQAP